MVDIESIKNRLTVNKVIWYYLKNDMNITWQHKYLSPFKEEKTPSLVATDVKQLWKDFSSWKWGDIFAFIKEYKGYNFYETLNELNEVFNLWLDLSDLSFNKWLWQKQLDIYKIHDKIVNFCIEELFKKENKHVLNYLTQDRWLSLETIERFKIWLSKERLLEDYVLTLLKEFPEVKKNDISLFNDKWSFLFSDRIMYPVKTLYWKVVAFSWWRINKEQEPKYIHSTNNIIYEKSHNLLNIDKVNFIYKDIYICEWNIDTIQLYNYWSEKSIALLWTTLSQTQINIFINRVEQVTLLLDNDSAWNRAMYEIAKKMYRHWKRVYIFNLWKSKDIDDFLLSKPELKWNIDDYIDENKKELLADILIPNYIKSEKILKLESKQDILRKIKDLYISIPKSPEYFSFRTSYESELKKWDIDIKSYTMISWWEDNWFPDLNEEQKLDMTLREIKLYEEKKILFLDKKERLEKEMEKIELPEIWDIDVLLLIKFIEEELFDLKDDILNKKFWMDIKSNYNKFLKDIKNLEYSQDFLNKKTDIKTILTISTDNTFENIKVFLKNTFNKIKKS